ncbi:MAG: hypothetical protein AB1629_08275 [Candidatus Omnitrophota bacterium]
MKERIKRILSLVLSFGLLFQQVGFAQMATELNIANSLSRIGSSIVQDRFRPLHLRYFSYDNLNDNFKILLDKGDFKNLKIPELEVPAKTLLSYFLVGVALPDNMFWVNLRPDSEDRIIDPWLEKTDVGRIMLEADLQLKKDTAAMTSPDTPEGKLYWDKLYKKAAELYGYDNITIPALTRPWIVPGEIIVRESKDSAYVYKATLKVMLEQDYLKDSATYNFKDERSKALNEYSSQLIRELIIPKLTKEVNSSKRYAALRQVYYSLILSRWFKLRFTGKTGTYASLINTRNLTNLTSQESWTKTTYFKQYQKSFQEGEYNIKEPVYTPTGQVIRSYFSGGINVASSAINTQNGIVLSNDNANKLGDIIGGKAVIDPRSISLQSTVVSSSSKASEELSSSPITFKEIDDAWDSKMQETETAIKNKQPKQKIFNYTLTSLISDAKNRLPVGKLIKMFNPGRGGKRPATAKLDTMEPPFVEEAKTFCFMTEEESNQAIRQKKPEDPVRRMNPKEIIAQNVNYSGIDTDIIINTNPFYRGHVLFVPERLKKHNQVFTEEAARVALAVLRDINRPSYKTTFNSWQAWGSINHLHLQGFDYSDPNGLSSLPVERETSELLFSINRVSVSTLPNWMVRTIVLSSAYKDSEELEKQILKLTKILYELKQPFNILFTYNTAEENYKVYVFPRAVQGPSKFGTGVAYLELSGEILFINQNFGGIVLTSNGKTNLDEQKANIREILRVIDPKQLYEWYETADGENLKYYLRPSRSGREAELKELNIDDPYMAYASLIEEQIINIHGMIKDPKAVNEAFQQLVNPVYETKSKEMYDNVDKEALEAEIAAVGIDETHFQEIVGRFKAATASSPVGILSGVAENGLRKATADERLAEFWAVFPGRAAIYPVLYAKVTSDQGYSQFRKETTRHRDTGGRFFVQYLPYSPDFRDYKSPRTPEEAGVIQGDRRYTIAYKQNAQGQPWEQFLDEEVIGGVAVRPFDAPKPYGAGHTVLVVRMDDNLDQALIEDAIRVALELVRKSEYSEQLKIGFNGLGAYASTPQLHLQALFFEDEHNRPTQMPVETFATRNLATTNGVSVSELEGYPTRGFVFEGSDIAALNTVIHNAVWILQNIPSGGNPNSTPHNLIFTKTESGLMRVFIFPRKLELKDKVAPYKIGAAFVELGGVLQVSDPSIRNLIIRNGVDRVAKEELKRVDLDDADYAKTKEAIKHVLSFFSSPEMIDREVLGLLFNQFLSPDDNVKAIAKDVASRLSLTQLRHLKQLLQDKYNATRDKSPMEEHQDYFGMGLEDSVIVATAKEALEYLEVLERNPANISSSPLQSITRKTGGIDFRVLPMTIQPMGSFRGLNFKVPQLSQAILEQINIDSEMQQIKNMVQAGIAPSGQRIKELIAACMQKKEMSSQVDSLLICLADIFKLEEENASESSPELREALAIVDSQS